MLQIIRHIVRKEFIQTFRDKRMLIPLFVAPVIQLILFGYAATTDIKRVSIGILDHDRSQESRAFISTYMHNEIFKLDYFPSASQEVDDLFQTGKIKAAIIIPDGFERDLKTHSQAKLQIILDGTDANSATIIASHIAQNIQRYSENILSEILGQDLSGFVIPQPRIWYNPELMSSIYMVPGVICLILLLTTLVLTSMAITKEREMGTLEQLIVSPIKAHELIIGKTAPFTLIGLVDVTLVIIAGKVVFGLPIRGSLLFLFGASFIFILTTLSLGLFISTISKTQQQAIMTALFFIMPAMLLSGIFSPIESMPRIIQHITLLNPLRHFGKAVRGILLKGNDLSILWPEVLALFLFGVAALLFSSLRFRKHLE
jgi:ABC-2 type transport system permease protein